MQALTREQAQTFLSQVAGDRLEALYVLALATGARQGELLGLRWEDVDLEAGRLAIRHTLSRIDGSLGDPKTARGRRTVPLPPFVVTSLREHRRRQLEQRLAAGRRWVDGGFVFTTRTGTALHSKNVLRAFQAALERAALPRVRFHDLRHSAATLLLAQGVSIHEVSWMLGHASIAITADTYGHASEASERRTAAAMQAALTG
jgi:integrase